MLRFWFAMRGIIYPINKVFYTLNLFYVLFMHFLDIILFLRFYLVCDKQQNNSHSQYICIISSYVIDFQTIFVEISFYSQTFILHLFYTIAVVQMYKMFQLLWHIIILLVQKIYFFSLNMSSNYYWIIVVYFSKLHDCCLVCMNLHDCSRASV